MSLSAYTTDANPQLLYASDEAAGEVDQWVGQLARVSGHPVDLFVDVPDRRVVWNSKAARGRGERVGKYLVDFQSDGEDATPIFEAFHDHLDGLAEHEGWEFRTDGDDRWGAGFRLAGVESRCPGLSSQEEAILGHAVGQGEAQLVLGMSSYPAALETVKRLTERGVDGTIAINSDGATAETEGVDLVLWPGAEHDFQPMTERTKEVLARDGFGPASRLDLVEDRPSQGATEVTDQYTTPSPLESFVGDGIGRVGLGLTVVLSAASLGSLASVSSLYPLSGLAAIGGLVGGFLGLTGVQHLAAELDDGSARDFLFDTEEWAWQQYSAFVGFYLLFGYTFPSVFRLLEWPLGITNTVGATLNSAAIYVGAIAAVWLALYVAWAVRSEESPSPLDAGAIVAINALFALGLIATNGLACALWFDVIGFVGNCG